MWLLGINVKSLNAYRKALKVDKYDWANKAEVSSLLAGAYPRASREELQRIVRSFEAGKKLPAFSLGVMQQIVCNTEGIVLEPREIIKEVTKPLTSEAPTTKPKIKRNAWLHCQRKIPTYNFKFDGSRTEELKAKFCVEDINPVSWVSFLPIAFEFGNDKERIKKNLEHWKKTGEFIDELNYRAIEQFVLDWFYSRQRSKKARETTSPRCCF